MLVSAAVHSNCGSTVFRDIAIIGPSFMLNAVAGLMIAFLLLLWRHWIPVILTIGFGAATLGHSPSPQPSG